MPNLQTRKQEMKKILFTIMLFMSIVLSGYAQANKIIGKWKTIDDKDGSAKSIVEIFKATNGKYYGKIVKLFKEQDRKCTDCQGSNKDKPILGMMIVENLVDKDGKLAEGTILDPKNGKVYNCSINIDGNDDKLNVRGSLDRFGMVGRNQTWIRFK